MKATSNCYLDSNILVYFSDQDSLHFQGSVTLIQKLADLNVKIAISPLCIDEFIYSWIKIFRSKKITDYYGQLDKLLKLILKIPNLEIKNPPEDLKVNSKIVNLMKKYQLRPRDAYHLLIMMSHKISHFATFDKDFEKVFKSKIVSLYKI